MKIAKPAHYFRKFERCFDTCQRLNRSFFSRKLDKNASQGQEKDFETTKSVFELRIYDPRIKSWLTTSFM
ncbi:hypothetical protein TPENAI_60746 [Tenacibaculum litopenaei]